MAIFQFGISFNIIKWWADWASWSLRTLIYRPKIAKRFKDQAFYCLRPLRFLRIIHSFFCFLRVQIKLWLRKICFHLEQVNEKALRSITAHFTHPPSAPKATIRCARRSKPIFIEYLWRMHKSTYEHFNWISITHRCTEENYPRIQK